VISWRIEVNDKINIVNVNTASRDISRNQYSRFLVFETSKCSGANSLGLTAVQRSYCDSSVREIQS
jgi:thioredoxin-related protein